VPGVSLLFPIGKQRLQSALDLVFGREDKVVNAQGAVWTQDCPLWAESGHWPDRKLFEAEIRVSRLGYCAN